MVKIVDVNEYIMLTRVLSKYPSFRLVIESLKSSDLQWKSE